MKPYAAQHAADKEEILLLDPPRNHQVTHLGVASVVSQKSLDFFVII